MIWLITAVVSVLAAAAAYRWRMAALQAEQTARLAKERHLCQEEAHALRSAATAEAEVIRRRAEVATRAVAQQTRHDAELAALQQTTRLGERALANERRERELADRQQRIDERATELQARELAMRERESQARAVREQTRLCHIDVHRSIESRAGETTQDIHSRLVAQWIEEAQTQAADRLRRVDASVNDPAHTRTAKRIMGISIQRYRSHYLTERLLTNVPVEAERLKRIVGAREDNLRIIEDVSRVKLSVSDSGESLRIEGQDSFGREIARRAIARLGKSNGRGEGEVRKLCLTIADELDREVVELGRRAFKELDLPRAHPDIVKLVGKLNYRTSYTQNQWKHALEAAFLCGMMASELGLDVHVARRAALLHDIGKALTHEIDGSHAVIGADLARQLGESELVANAIGAHHTDEPFNSPYALLVAAADALSGARPGARRQQDENYVERLEQLRQLVGTFPGVDVAYPVQGGREVRIYVQENHISDARAVEMSSEIARQISKDMTFPGQIKVTVIREVRAIAVAN